jgi:uncharacterized protein YbaP (TraB family)
MRKISLVNLFLAVACVLSLQASDSRAVPVTTCLEISGNGLKNPSYLFGTMHLKDKRVFDFSDSVLVKLDECPTFAMEILPDSILKAVSSNICLVQVLIQQTNSDRCSRPKNMPYWINACRRKPACLSTA